MGTTGFERLPSVLGQFWLPENPRGHGRRGRRVFHVERPSLGANEDGGGARTRSLGEGLRDPVANRPRRLKFVCWEKRPGDLPG